VSKETYSYGKRDLFIWQKRPIYMAKETYDETYSYGKRDLFIWQQRPIHMAKETYSYGKRDLFIWQKRPTNTSRPEAKICAMLPSNIPGRECTRNITVILRVRGERGRGGRSKGICGGKGGRDEGSTVTV